MKRTGWFNVICICFGTLLASHGAIPTDFKAEFISVQELEQKLATEGFSVVGKHAVAGSTNHTSVIYTCDALKNLAGEKERGFIAALRILHNAETKELIVSNPEYFIRAYYQKKYTEGSASPVLNSLKAAVGNLRPTEDALETKKLAKYKFMIGMPKYDDFVRVAKGSNADLINRLEKNAKERLVFKLDIKGDGSSLLCGVALPDNIETFNEKLGTMEKSHLLPYTVLIENGEANILHAKFYLALSFPQLTMTEFMKIMSVPGNIEDAFKADFK